MDGRVSRWDTRFLSVDGRTPSSFETVVHMASDSRWAGAGQRSLLVRCFNPIHGLARNISGAPIRMRAHRVSPMAYCKRNVDGTWGG